MGTVKRFEDFEVWKKSRVFADKIYKLSNIGTFANDYSLKNQINASAGSIMDNIAEGFERGGTKEFIQFLYYSKGSCGEARSQLYRARDRNYLTSENFDELFNEAEEISKMLSGLTAYLQTSDIKGIKFTN